MNYLCSEDLIKSDIVKLYVTILMNLKLEKIEKKEQAQK